MLCVGVGGVRGRSEHGDASSDDTREVGYLRCLRHQARGLESGMPLAWCWGILEPSLIHNAACHYIRLGGIVHF